MVARKLDEEHHDWRKGLMRWPFERDLELGLYLLCSVIETLSRTLHEPAILTLNTLTPMRMLF